MRAPSLIARCDGHSCPCRHQARHTDEPDPGGTDRDAAAEGHADGAPEPEPRQDDPPEPARDRVRHLTDTIERVLDERAWTQEALAEEIGLSRVHFNRLLNHRRQLTRRSRRKLKDWAERHSISPEDLWVRREHRTAA